MFESFEYSRVLELRELGSNQCLYEKELLFVSEMGEPDFIVNDESCLEVPKLTFEVSKQAPS